MNNKINIFFYFIFIFLFTFNVKAQDKIAFIDLVYLYNNSNVGKEMNNEMFLDDDGMGNVRVYYLVSGIKTVHNATQGTINYGTGQVTLNSLDVASISNIRGSASSKIEVTVSPSSNDVVPVRDQILEIDVSNSIVNVTEDTFVGGSSEAGVGYTTSSSY